jgi:transcriptional regulator with XRE-family HTH domain
MRVQALVAWNLRRLRVGRDLSQENLAVDARVDRTYVSRLDLASVFANTQATDLAP